MRSTRRPTAVGAIAASVLVLAATACGSSSDDSVGESVGEPPPAAVETTVDATGSTDDATPGTESPSATTAATATPAPADTGVDVPATTPAVVVPEALQFTAPLVGGGTFDGADVAGTPTVFWFWAPT